MAFAASEEDELPELRAVKKSAVIKALDAKDLENHACFTRISPMTNPTISASKQIFDIASP
jgi:hypothetical protein